MATVLTCYYRPKPGGFCKRLVRAMRALADQGHTVHYLAVEPFAIQHDRCFFHRFPWPADKTDTWLFWGIFYLSAPIFLFWLGLRCKATHAFGFSPVYVFSLKPLQMIKAVKVACFLRGDVLQAHAYKKRPKWVLHLDALIEGLAVHQAHIVSQRQALLDKVLLRHPHAGPARTSILPNDLPAAIVHTKVVRLPLWIGTVGIFEPVKNQAWTIDLFSNLNKGQFCLHFFGDGPDEKSLAAKVRARGLSSWVTFQGWQAPDEIWPNLDVLIMPSLDEGMPNAVLEAVAHHVVVLASDIDAHRQILPQTHCLPLEKPEAWTAILKAVAENPDVMLKKMAKAQLLQAQALVFDWEARVVELIVPYQQTKQ